MGMTKKPAARHGKLRLADVDLDEKLEDKKEYERRIEAVQLRLLRAQQREFHTSQRAVIALEGWDASGKGGAIKRLTESVDPRGYQVHAIGAPTAEEQGRHYLWRFWQKLPTPGRWAIFDRTWYGRVLVERVEKLVKKGVWGRAYDEINSFEKMLTDDGCRVVKIFLNIDKREQLVRFEERQANPYKKWKITEEDWRNRKRWKEYEKAIDEMLTRTSTPAARWNVVAANYKWYARVRVAEIIADALE